VELDDGYEDDAARVTRTMASDESDKDLKDVQRGSRMPRVRERNCIDNGSSKLKLNDDPNSIAYYCARTRWAKGPPAISRRGGHALGIWNRSRQALPRSLSSEVTPQALLC